MLRARSIGPMRSRCKVNMDHCLVCTVPVGDRVAWATLIGGS